MTGFRYVPKPLPTCYPDWLKEMMQTAIEWANEANDWFGLPLIWVDPSFAELRPLAITDGRDR